MCSRIIASASRGTTSHATRSITSRATLLTASALTPVSRAALRTAAIDSGLLPGALLARAVPGFAGSPLVTAAAGADAVCAGALGTAGVAGNAPGDTDAGAAGAVVAGLGPAEGLESGTWNPTPAGAGLGAGGCGDRVGAALGVGVDEAAAGPSAANGSSKPPESLRSGSLEMAPKPAEWAAGSGLAGVVGRATGGGRGLPGRGGGADGAPIDGAGDSADRVVSKGVGLGRKPPPAGGGGGGEAGRTGGVGTVRPPNGCDSDPGVPKP